MSRRLELSMMTLCGLCARALRVHWPMPFLEHGQRDIAYSRYSHETLPNFESPLHAPLLQKDCLIMSIHISAFCLRGEAQLRLT
jgi:hypothetical protein